MTPCIVIVLKKGPGCDLLEKHPGHVDIADWLVRNILPSGLTAGNFLMFSV